MAIESAIPEHLQCPRTRTPRASAEYAPPYPAWVARLRPSVKQLTMAYHGVQWCQQEQRSGALAAVRQLTELLKSTNGPRHSDCSHYLDEAGHDTIIVASYWDNPASFDKWCKSQPVHQWWMSPARQQQGLGCFREIYSPRSTHMETLFSTPDRFEGVALLAEGRSGEIQEHAYWGSARDRLPASQTEPLTPAGQAARRTVSEGRILVSGHEHLALIRSGQDWSKTTGRERALYLDQVEPVLRQGMDFLRDAGASVGCYFNRYLTRVDVGCKPQEKSFGLSAWRSLEHMERWAESHPTHIAIFGNFMSMVQELNAQLQLRLYHEVTIVKADEQQFEYVNCHPRTGLLKAAAE